MTNSIFDYAKTLHDSGKFNCYEYDADDKREKTWFIFEEKETGNIGTAQNGDFSGIRLGTIHKPNIKTGTGFSLDDVAPTVPGALLTAATSAPDWATNSQLGSVNKYKNFEEYAAAPVSLKYKKMFQ